MEEVGFTIISSDLKCVTSSDRWKEQEHKQDEVKGTGLVHAIILDEEEGCDFVT